MRSFGSLAVRQVRARRGRAMLTAAGIVLGVAMILGVLLLAATINRTFSDLYDSVYGRTDLVVSGSGEDTLGAGTLGRVRRTAGVEEAEGNVFSVFTLVDERGEASTDAQSTLNVAGEDPEAADFTDAETIAGRAPEHGLEISLQSSWADANEIAPGDRISLATPAGAKRFEVVGLFQFSTGLDFGGQGFATMPLQAAREVMDKPRGFDEIDVVVSGGSETIAEVDARLDRALPRGVEIETPEAKSEDIESRLQAFNAILYFFAAMALFVGGFLIFNSFNMTVLQRTREIGMLRTLGASRGQITASVLREAALLGLLGAAFGLALAVAFFSATLLAVGAAGRVQPELMLPAAVVTFAFKMAVIGLLLFLLRDTAAFDRAAFALALVAGTVIYLAAEIRFAMRAKVPYVVTGEQRAEKQAGPR